MLSQHGRTILSQIAFGHYVRLTARFIHVNQLLFSQEIRLEMRDATSEPLALIWTALVDLSSSLLLVRVLVSHYLRRDTTTGTGSQLVPKTKFFSRFNPCCSTAIPTSTYRKLTT